MIFPAVASIRAEPLGKRFTFPPREAHGSGAAACLQSPEVEDCDARYRLPAGEEQEEVNTGLVHSGRIHPLGVITGSTCSVSPAKGVAKTRSLIDIFSIYCV